MALGDFVTLQRGHDLPDTRRRPGRIPVMGSFGPTGYHDEPKTKGPGITVGRRSASFGVVNYCSVDYWPLNTALYVTDFHGNDERFAYYLLKTIDFTAYNSGSAQPSLNRNFIHPLRIRVPAPNEQRRIANILGTLDDKIELNRRMNETLEAMARRLFKSWFIDFDPVHAKAALRRPLPPRPAQHGPRNRRTLPRQLRGFHARCDTEGMESRSGRRHRRQPQTRSQTIRHSSRNTKYCPRTYATPLHRTERVGHADDVASGKFCCQRGEILFGKLRPYFHKDGVPAVDGVCSTDVLVITPREQNGLVYCWATFPQTK